MKMSLRNAAFQVLKEAEKPLNAEDIAKRILDAELWETAGKTPGASVGAVLYTDIKNKGDKSVFVKHKSGYFALRDNAELQEVKVVVRPPTEKTSKESPNALPQSKNASGKTEENDYRSSVIQVLKEDDKPFIVEDIAKRPTDAELCESTDKTAGATVDACIHTDIQVQGDKSVFVKPSRELFTLQDVNSGFKDAEVLSKLSEEKLPVAKPPLAKSPLLRDTHVGPKTVLKAPVESIKVLPSFESYTFIECAEKVLEEFGNKKPMHYREITEIALEKAWLVTEGKTPEASMSAAVFNDNNRRQKRGELARFIQHGGGFLSLSKWVESGQEFQLEFQIAQQNQEVKNTLKERLLAMHPIGFEGLVKELLEVIGFKAERTPPTHDKGIDVRGTLVVGDVIRIKMAVQVKRFRLKTNIGAPVVQQLRGSLGAHEQGLIITTSDFSKGAKIEAARSDTHPIALMNGNELIALLMEHEVGVKCFTHPLFKIKESFFSGECTDDLDIEID